MIPIGMANMAPSRVTMIDPTIALAIPPPSPTGFGISVKNDKLSDVIPWATT